jgi:hypothetical protein
VVEFVWLVPPERLTPERRELAFPEFCCLLLTLGGPNVTKEFVPFVPRGAGVTVDPIMFDPEDWNVTVGVGAEAWALPIGVPPGVLAVALAAVLEGGGGGRRLGYRQESSRLR